MAVPLLIMVFMACASGTPSVQDESAVVEALRHLDTLHQQNTVVAWRGAVQFPGRDIPESIDDYWQHWDEDVVVTERALVSRLRRSTEPHTGVMELVDTMWENDVLTTLTHDGGRSFILAAEPFRLGSMLNPTQLALPGLLFANPRHPGSIAHAIRNGQILRATRTEEELVLGFYVDDLRADRWSIVIERSEPPRLVQVVCEQLDSTRPPDEERVVVHSTLDVLEWDVVGGVNIPTRARRTIRADMSDLAPEERLKEADEDGVIVNHAVWELKDVRVLHDESGLEQRRAQFHIGKNDYVSDWRLDIGYRIVGDTITQVGQQFRLPPGETIDDVLDESFLARLQSLDVVSRRSPSPEQREESPIGRWAVVGGGCLLLAGLLGLFMLRRRGSK